jgi:Pregnancy-associated plasma protein-A
MIVDGEGPPVPIQGDSGRLIIVAGWKKCCREIERRVLMAEQPETRLCATMPHHYYLAETDQTYQINRREIETFSASARLMPRTAVIRIPVVVHVLYNTDAENISQTQIDSQIEALNRDYRLRNADQANIPEPFRAFVTDTLIEFALAVRDPQGQATTGITRTFTSMQGFPYNQFDRRATEKLDNWIKHDEFGKAAWPRDNYLNMWVCTIQGGLLGYAQFPGGAASTDGVVINNTAFGSNGIAQAPFNLGRTAVHEVGHWLNLLHIWGDDGQGCSGSDNVQDTPNQAGSNNRKPRFPRISCNNEPNGDMFMNYMDYVDDDTMVMFTKGQLERMNATLMGPRASLAQSQGLVPIMAEPVALLGDVPRTRAALMSLVAEQGEHVERVFDGVSWIPIS